MTLFSTSQATQVPPAHLAKRDLRTRKLKMKKEVARIQNLKTHVIAHPKVSSHKNRTLQASHLRAIHTDNSPLPLKVIDVPEVLLQDFAPRVWNRQRASADKPLSLLRTLHIAGSTHKIQVTLVQKIRLREEGLYQEGDEMVLYEDSDGVPYRHTCGVMRRCLIALR